MTTAAALAVDGGPKTREKPWPTWPVWGTEEERAILEVLRSGQWWAVGGCKVTELERAFAAFQDARHAVCVTNGTAALEVTLRGLGIGCGDEVIVPPYTFVATASSVLAVAATPVFVDIEPGSLNLDPARIEEAVTERTRAIIPVHIGGRPADMDGIMEVAARHGLRVVEDAAQAHGAEWRGRKVGAIGDAGTFSFQASKNLNAGEGGAIVTNDDDVADRVWSVHNVGRTRTGRWYEHHVLGGNFRMTEWQGAILLAQLGRLAEQTERRTRNAERLTAHLREIPGVITMPDDARVTRNAYHLYILRYDTLGFGGRSRDEFLRALGAEGVPASAGYVPLYREVLFQRKSAGQGSWCRAGRPIDYGAVECPVCEQVCRDGVWLFQNLLLGEPSDMDDIAEAIARIQRAWA
ncbi:MAG: DegT/DnrJ/EryC1/StrS family aminotransferase [Chthonomonadales bacterium]|nr:DegT/DnrJ/EryC1/StrS family aminotransferase [Chthonomonadales bacterium]